MVGAGNFTSFIRILIKKFKQQSYPPNLYNKNLRMVSTQTQFAVLYLSSADSDQELLNSSNFHTIGSKRNASTDQNPLTDRKKPTYPKDEELYNYITSRQHDSDHAEELIMNKFTTLVEKDENEAGNLKYIILYTWLFPCKKCRSKIISKFESKKYKIKTYVLYSVTRNEEKEGKKEGENDLRKAGIKVKRVHMYYKNDEI